MRIAVLSDTHGLLRESVLGRIGGAELILHGGDVGRPQILDTLRTIAPTRVVRGNIDKDAFGLTLPETERIDLPGGSIYMVHDIADLAIDPTREGARLVVFGHSHSPESYERDGTRYLNPGSIGPRRFKLPISFALLDWSVDAIEVEFVTLEE